MPVALLLKKCDLPDIFAAAAHAPTLLCAGRRDVTFKFADFERTEPIIRAAYEEAGCPERFETHVEDVAHKHTDAVYEKGTAWFRKWPA
jgi:hypothetical protein